MFCAQTVALGVALLIAVLRSTASGGGDGENGGRDGSASPVTALSAQVSYLVPQRVLGLGVAGFVGTLTLANLSCLRGGFRSWLIHQLVEYRAAVLVCFACPVSVMVWLINTTRARYNEAFARPEDHDERVAAVCAQVRRWADGPDAGRRPMCTARANWQNLSTRFVNKDVLHKIELSQLRDVLSVDAAEGERGTVRCVYN